MKTIEQQKDYILKAFITPAPAIGDALHSYVKVAGADECLRLAAIAVQPAIMEELIEAHGANPLQIQTTHSDRRANTPIKRSLMDIVTDSVLYRTDVNRENAYDAISVLAKSWQDRKPSKKVAISVLINEDPLESPIMAAHLLAYPDLAKDAGTPHYKMLPGTALGENPQADKKLLCFFVGRVPDDVKKFTAALEEEKTRLRAEFAAAQNLREETIPLEPRSVSKAAASLVFSTLRK